MDQVNPKGGALVRTSVSHRSEDQLHKEAKKVVKSFPHMTIEQAKMGLLKDIYAEIYDYSLAIFNVLLFFVIIKNILGGAKSCTNGYDEGKTSMLTF